MPSLMEILNRVDDAKTISFPMALAGNSSAAKKDRLAKISMADRVNDPTYHYPAECPVMPIGQSYDLPYYYAHFIGKVEISEVYDIHPCEMSRTDMEMWARADGFAFLDVAPAISEMGHRSANDWFTQQYGDWIQRWWTVERWDGWLERYFEPEAIR